MLRHLTCFTDALNHLNRLSAACHRSSVQIAWRRHVSVSFDLARKRSAILLTPRVPFRIIASEFSEGV